MKHASPIHAYAAARYRVLVGRVVYELRVGSRAVALEQSLPAATRFAVLTAANPGSAVLDERTNLARDLALLGALDRFGACRFPGENAAPDGSHREASWLVCDLPDSALDRLAREFGQAAVLAWRRGRPAALRWYAGR